MIVCAPGWSEMSDRTRIVRGLRILLPLLALVILSTMFLFSRPPGTEPRIPYADVDAEDMIREPRMVGPEHAGMTDDGTELTLRAAQAIPGRDGNEGRASHLALNWKAPDGLEADLTAPDARMAEGVISLSGGVDMRISSGWTIAAPRIDAATDRTWLQATDGIEAEAPFGTLSAGAMELAPDPAGNDGSILDFTSGVRLIYLP